jgi:phosphopantothenoylcysteine decarboxylase / phosphopantothenate---cysteine ligase
MLKGKHILLGITGSIAAYKAAMLIRLLVKEGAQVKVIMTDMAKQFISPLTMATLSHNPVLIEFYNPENGDWNSHVSLGLWADLYIIAPASANTLAKMAYGIADNLLLTAYLSARCPVLAAPAMDVDMFSHQATQSNIQLLKNRGVHIVEPASGELASGLDGKGRMEDPEVILGHIRFLLSREGTLKGKKVLVTAGPTQEAIDPVRFISNHSSGKMAYALADSFACRGADVTLVSGPVSINPSLPNISLVKVVSAEEMMEQTTAIYRNGVDITVLCAAVSDFTPAHRSDTKIKRKGDSLSIDLLPTKDIAATLGASKKKGTLLVGFALETDNELQNASEKLKKKNLDLIVLNSLQDKGAAFAGDTNKVSLIFPDGQVLKYPLKSKREVADDIIDNIEKLLVCLKD